MKKREEEAVRLFRSGFNCAQSVLSVFSEDLDMNAESLRSLSAGFGGGMGKMQETCGAVTGAFMLFGIYSGKKTDNNNDAKVRANELVLAYTDKFKEARGSIRCRDLLGVDMHSEEGKIEIERRDLFGTVCEDCISLSVGIVEGVLGEAIG